MNRFQFETEYEKSRPLEGTKNYGVENPKFTYKASRGGGWERRDGVFFDEVAGAVEFDYEERDMSRIAESSSLRITILDSSRKDGVILGEVFVNLLTLLVNRCLTYDLTCMHGEAGHKFRSSNTKHQRDDLIHAVNRSQINGERRNFHVVINIEMSPYVQTGIKMNDVRLDSTHKFVDEFGECPWAEFHMSRVRLRWHHATFQDIAKCRVKFEEDATAHFDLKLKGKSSNGNYSESLPSSSDRIMWLKDSLLGMRTSFLIFELQSKGFFSTHWKTIGTAMVPLRHVFDKNTDDKAVWFFDPVENKGYVQMRTSKTKRLNAFVRFQYKLLKHPDTFVTDIKHVYDHPVLYVTNDAKDGIVPVIRESASSLSSSSPRSSSMRKSSLADCYIKKKGIHLSKSQNSVLDAIDAAYDMYKNAQMSKDDLKTHIKTLSGDAGLPGLKDVISKYYKNNQSPSECSLSRSTKRLRNSIHIKDMKQAHTILTQMKSMEVPSVKELKTTGAGRLLDTISKRMRDKSIRNKAQEIITKWKSELKLRRGATSGGKKILRTALSA